MAKENVGKFYEAIMADEEKKNRLTEISKQYSEQEMNEALRLQLAEEHIVPMAADMGLEFSTEELRTYETELLEQKKASGELSEKELEGVAGGVLFGGFGVCAGIGFALGGAIAICFFVGV